jgi:hypothetical protein
MVPDENISAMAEAPAIHHLFLNIAFLPPFGDIAPEIHPCYVTIGCHSGELIVFQSTRPESFRRETRSLNQKAAIRAT